MTSDRDIEDRMVWHNRPLSKTLIAQLFGVSRQTIHRWLKDGRLQGQRISDVLISVQGESDEKDST